MGKLRAVINKIGNIEIEDNILKFRMPLTEFNTQDITTIEKNIKRKMTSIEEDPYYLKPFEIRIINSSMVLYYQMESYAGFTYLRQLDFTEKLKYYTSLIEIAKRQETTKVLWDKFNFFVDPLEENIKTIIFETENMKIHEKTDSFSGIKELILISLTTLETVLGKPTKADFIEKDDFVIQFAETVLKIEDLDDLDHYISTKRIEYEHGLIENETSAPVEKETKRKINLPFGNLKNKKNKVKINQPRINQGQKKKKDNSNKNLFILLGVLGFAIIFHFTSGIFLGGSEDSNENKKEENKPVVTASSEMKTDKKQSDSTVKVTDKKYNEQLLEAYRLSLKGDNKNAVKILEAIGYDKLSVEDQTILLNIYENAGQINKVIDLEPERAKELVSSMVANAETEKLLGIQKAMKTKNPYVDFEVAYLKDDWKQVIALKDQVDLNGTKEEQIVDSYIALENYEEGKKFAEMVGNPALLEKINTFIAN